MAETDTSPKIGGALHWGAHVKANFGAGTTLAHLLDSGHKAENNETKYSVQDPRTGDARDLTYREPADRDANGSGGTFWTLDE